MSQEAFQRKQHQDTAEAATFTWQWADPAAVRAEPWGAERPAPPGPYSLALGQQPVREQ